jgi:hypothetical protein
MQNDTTKPGQGFRVLPSKGKPLGFVIYSPGKGRRALRRFLALRGIPYSRDRVFSHLCNGQTPSAFVNPSRLS